MRNIYAENERNEYIEDLLKEITEPAYPDIFNIFEVSCLEVTNGLISMNYNKEVELDGILTIFLRRYTDTLCVPILKQFNLSEKEVSNIL